MATAYTVIDAFTPVPVPHRAGEETAVRAEFSLSGALVINDTIDLVTIPAGHAVTDIVLFADDLDSGGSPAVTLDVGIKGGDTDAFFAASTVAQAGGAVHPSVKTAFRDVATSADRVVQALVKAAPATSATTGKLGVLIRYMAK